MTDAAIKSWQKRGHLEETGLLDAATPEIDGLGWMPEETLLSLLLPGQQPLRTQWPSQSHEGSKPDVACSGGMLSLVTGQASDWPMWRADPGRTGVVEATVPENLEVLWERELPAPAPAYHDVRLQFDGGPEPIVFHGLVIVASSREDSVTAFESETGKEVWTFLTDGPVRFAPVAADGRIIFGSDDGCVYALSADDGSLQWKHRAVPSDRLVLGIAVSSPFGRSRPV
ncbi:MAG: PQQ-binding-like beta-propeller repeat protein [Verrucomicrobiales bacterium]